MFNTKNTCEFEGRLSTDVTMASVGQGANAFATAKFSIAVERNLNTAQKATKKAEQNLPFAQKTLQTADFIMCQATGKTAEAIGNYFAKGKAIKIFATYRSYSTVDKATGTTKYGASFDVEHFGFLTADSAASAGQNGGQAPQQQQQQNNYSAPQQQNNNYVKQNNQAPNVVPINDDDVPF